MREGKRKVLLVSSQPIQNAATLRLMAVHRDFEVLTAYCSLPDARLWRDDEHLNKEVPKRARARGRYPVRHNSG